MLVQMALNMDVETKDKLCTDLGQKADSDLLSTMLNSGIDCLDTLSRDENVGN